jgi:hypothetical protein
MVSSGSKRDASSSQASADSERAPRRSRWGPPVSSPPSVPQGAANNAGFSIPAQRPPQQRRSSRWGDAPSSQAAADPGTFSNALTVAGAGALSQESQVMVVAMGQMAATIVQPMMHMIGELVGQNRAIMQNITQLNAQARQQSKDLSTLGAGVQQAATSLPGRLSDAVQEKRQSSVTVKERLSKLTEISQKYITHIAAAFSTVTGEVCWMPVTDSTGQTVILLNISGLVLFYEKRVCGFKGFTGTVPEHIKNVKEEFAALFTSATTPKDPQEFDALLRQTPFTYTSKEGKYNSRRCSSREVV